MLDRSLGRLCTTSEWLKHPRFGLQIAAYVEWCILQGCAPRGRVICSFLGIGFRLDAQRGKSINILHLYQIQLESFKFVDVCRFVNKVRFVLANLQASDIRDDALMFEWL